MLILPAGLRVLSPLAIGRRAQSTGPFDVTWENPLRVTINGSSLTGTAIGSQYGGARSTLFLLSGDGYVQTVIAETNKTRYIALSQGDAGCDAVSGGYTELGFAIRPTSDGKISVYEFGVSKFASTGSYVAGDVLKVAIEGGVVKYYQNATLLYTSTKAPVYPLVVDCAILYNGTLNACTMGGLWGSYTLGSDEVVWVPGGQAGSIPVQHGPTLKRTGAGTAWSQSGATSSRGLESGDGYVESTVVSSVMTAMFGLSSGAAANGDYTKLNHAWYPHQSGVAYIYESGAQRGSSFATAPGDVLRVAIEGGVVKYRQNGTLRLTSVVAPIYPTYVEAALGVTQASTVHLAKLGGGSWA